MAIKNYLLHIDEAAGAGTKNYYVPFDRLVNVDAVTIVANAAITGHAANYVTLTCYGNDGATALCARNTDTGGTGSTIAAGTSEDLTMLNAGKADFSGAQSLKITSVQAGSGVATNVVLNIQVSDARKF